MVKVAVNIVTFNSAGDITACLESLNIQTFRDFRIHVLDNASADGTLEKLIGFDLDIVRSPINTGFAKAHNDLIRTYPSEYVLVLNPDTILKPEFLDRLVCVSGSPTGRRFRHGQAAATRWQDARFDGHRDASQPAASRPWCR